MKNRKRKNLVKNLSIALLGKLSKTAEGKFLIVDEKNNITVERSFQSMLEFFEGDAVRINLRVSTAQHYDIYEYDNAPTVEDEEE